MTARIYPLRDPDAFRAQNNQQWAAITEFWLDAPLTHIAHVGDHFASMILARDEQPASILDMGCGNAWLLRRLRQAGWRGRYVGVDNNPRLVDALRDRTHDAGAEFYCENVESEPRPELPDADVVVNAFNFFELPNLSAGFAWASARLRAGGSLAVATIDPLSQILAICDSAEDLTYALELWASAEVAVAYEKRIDTEGGAGSNTYSGVLYGLSDFFKHAHDINLRLRRLEEIRRTARRPPQVYQLMEFRSAE